VARVLVCAPAERAERIARKVRAEFGKEPVALVDNPIDAVGVFLCESPTHVVIDGELDACGGVRIAGAMLGIRGAPMVLLADSASADRLRKTVAHRGFEHVSVRCWDGGPVPALFAEEDIPMPSIAALLEEPFEAVVFLGSAGTPHMLPRLLPKLRPGGVPLVVAVHHNPRLSDSFAEWVGEMTGITPGRGASADGTLPALCVARADSHVATLQPDLGQVLVDVLRHVSKLLIVVASGMEFEGLEAVRVALSRGATLVALRPDQCSQPAMVQRLLDAGLEPALCTREEIARVIRLASRVTPRRRVAC